MLLSYSQPVQLAEKEKALAAAAKQPPPPPPPLPSGSGGGAAAAAPGGGGAALAALEQRIQSLEKDLFEAKNATAAEEKAKKSALTTVRDTQVRACGLRVRAWGGSSLE